MNFPDILWKPRRVRRQKMLPGVRAMLVAQIGGRDGTDCHWCGRATVDRKPSNGRQLPDDLTLDHVLAWSHGGTDAPGNLVIACHGCNQERARSEHFQIEWKRMGARAPNRLFGCFVVNGEAT